LPGNEKPAGERIAKVIARAGICSRRDAEKLILEGRVKLDGVVITSPALNVTENNVVQVDEKPLTPPEAARLWRYHKPAGLVTTHRDEKGRATVFDALPKELPRLISVGRLDLNSEGLLLLTNDGELARRLELPANGWLRRYKVRVHGVVDPARLESLEKGVTIDGVSYGPIQAIFEGEQHASNAWLTVSLREGRNREVRKVMAHLGLAVTRLIRLAYGPFQLGNLPRGAIEEVPPRVMREQFGDEAKPGTATAEKKPERRTRPPQPKTRAERKPPRPGKRARENMHMKKHGHADHRR